MTATVAERLVDGVYDVELESLPADVVAGVKRALIDTVACAVGGVGSPAADAAVAAAEELGGHPTCTVIGSPLRTSPVQAALANGAMLRYLDYMDTVLFESDEGAVSATHPSELVPAILAAAEAGRCSGRELITAIAVAYELTAVLCERLVPAPLRDLGWHHSALAPYVLPAVAGRLWGATRDQAVQATGLAGLHNVVLNHVDADGEEVGASRNLAYPLVAASCLQDVALARAGAGGATRVAEGLQGFAEVVGAGRWTLDGIAPRPGCEGIRHVWMKPAVACVLGQAAATAVLELADERSLAPADVEAIELRVHPAALAHMGAEDRRFPTEKETADHSLYFLAAVAVRDGVVGPSQFSADSLGDEVVQGLAARVRLGTLDNGAAGGTAAAAAAITTRDGAVHEHRVDRPPGHPERPFSDSDIERKLRVCAEGRLGDRELDHFLDLVARLEAVDDAGDLMRPLAGA